MTTLLRRILLGATVVAVLTGDVVQSVGIRRQAARIVSLQKEVSRWQQQLAALQVKREEISASAAEQATSGIDSAMPSSGDASFDRNMGLLLVRVSRLKDRFFKDSRQQIPELRFLSDTTWFEVAEKHDLDSESDFREALGRLRSTAKMEFRSILTSALKAYLKDSANQLPSDIAQLSPYFVTPVDSALLSRYEMTASGSADKMSENVSVMSEKALAIVDRSYESVSEFSATGGYVVPASFGYSVEMVEPEAGSAPSDQRADSMTLWRAVQAYRNANKGNTPQNIQDLRPYFTNPSDAAKYLSFKPEEPPAEVR